MVYHQFWCFSSAEPLSHGRPRHTQNFTANKSMVCVRNQTEARKPGCASALQTLSRASVASHWNWLWVRRFSPKKFCCHFVVVRHDVLRSSYLLGCLMWMYMFDDVRICSIRIRVDGEVHTYIHRHSWGSQMRAPPPVT